jgi:hypothetical protein
VATPPVYISEGTSALNTTTPKTVSQVSEIGDLLIAMGGNENSNVYTLNLATRTSETFSVGRNEDPGSDLRGACRIDYLIATVAQTVNTSMSATAGGQWGLQVARFSGSDGVGNANGADAADGAPSVSLTTAHDNSAIICIIVDWEAGATTGKTWRTINGLTPSSGSDPATVGLELMAVQGSGHTQYAAFWADAGAAGAKTVGMTAPASQDYTIACLELRGTAAAGGQPARKRLGGVRFAAMQRGVW